MSTTKKLENNDVSSIRTILHESIPITGSLVSGTYKSGDTALNVKTYSHARFTSFFDYPFLSSSANHIFDIMTATDADSTDDPALTRTASGSTEKTNNFTEMCQVLFGHDATGTINKLRVSGALDDTGTIIPDPMFVNFSRLLYKDEIKKGTFVLTLGTDVAYATPFDIRFFIGDFGASQSFNSTNSPAGEYGVLRSGSSADCKNCENNDAVGLIFYQLGLVVLDLSSSFNLSALNQGSTMHSFQFVSGTNFTPTLLTYSGSVETGTMDELSDALAHRIFNIQFENSTEINSTIYFCRAGSEEFNFSSNPTYLSASQIRVKGNNPKANPVSYITTIGLYGEDNACLAAAKLSEPIRKSIGNDLTIRVRLDY